MMTLQKPEKPATLDQLADLTRRRGVRQFAKFCIVGSSSFTINFVVFNLLYHRAGLFLVPSLTIAFLLSVVNGFIWNRLWTFREAKHKPAHTQSFQFLVVNVVGWFLNTSIVVLVVAHHRAQGHGFFGDPVQFQRIVFSIVAGEGRQHYSPLLLDGALLVATCVVVFWNFFANRLWTFKH
ncbi:MAG: GtrA family protein [Armatimonadetes bacterium]|nr:GtrA family protein [Armatimonadota bacterium]